MDIKEQFPEVHHIWDGAISFVYEVHPHIVVKVPRCEDSMERFQNELKIYDILSRHPPCPQLVQPFYYTDKGIFLEYMPDESLAERIQLNHIKDRETWVVTKWMNDMAQAAAFFESLAHGDIRAENILLQGDRIKLTDLDLAGDIGSPCEFIFSPSGRALSAHDEEQGLGTRGTGGRLGARTEQSALASFFYYINYGFEPWENRRLMSVSRDRVINQMEKQENMEFPELNGDPIIDALIDKCWHNRYATVREERRQTRSSPH
ncbi:serine/threonine protein kinase [Aspergillus aurantiobrunneus]